MTGSTNEHDIRALEQVRLAALTSADIPTLASLMAEDLVHIHGNGHVDDKAAYLYGVETKYKFHEITRGDLAVRDYGDVVVVTGTLQQSVSVTGVDKINKIKAMTTQTWVRTTDGWKQNTCHNAFLAVE